jgi:hypothetical protein
LFGKNIKNIFKGCKKPKNGKKKKPKNGKKRIELKRFISQMQYQTSFKTSLTREATVWAHL